MTIKYVCRHCGMNLGVIERDDISEMDLGFHFLTPAERKDIITYNHDGDVVVRLSCDYCREALEANPELWLVPNALQ